MAFPSSLAVASLGITTTTTSRSSSGGTSTSAGSSPVNLMSVAPHSSSRQPHQQQPPALGSFHGGSYVGAFADGLDDEELEPEGASYDRVDSPPPKVQTVDAEKRPSLSSARRETSSVADLTCVADDLQDESGRRDGQEPPSIGPSADALLRTSPFLQDLLDRVVRTELSLQGFRDLSVQVETLRTDVDYLLRVQRERETARPRPVSSVAGSNISGTSPSLVSQSVASDGNAADSIQQLSLQLNSLTGSVAQLIQQSNTQAQQSMGLPMQQQPMPAPLAVQRGPRHSQVTESGMRSMSASPELRFTSPMPASNLPTPTMPSPHELAGQSPTASMSEWSTGTLPVPAGTRWEAIGLSPMLARAATSCGFGSSPSKIMSKAIPCIFADNDTVVQAPVVQERLGSYILPAMTYLSAPLFQHAANAIQVLVVCATVEEASQAQRYFTTLGARASLSVTSSGVDLTAELANLQTRPPQVLIGTPQRLLDLLALRSLAMHALRFLVIDEADNLVSRNLSDFVLSLVRLLPPCAFPTGRQTALFAASVPPEVLTFASSLHLRETVRVLVRRETAQAGGDIAPSVRGIRHHYLWIAMASKCTISQQSAAWKLEAVADLCEDAAMPQIVIFCNTYDMVEAVTFKLGSRGLEAHSLHEELSAATRQAVLARFRSSEMTGQANKKVLVVVDSLARTLHDVHQVPLVINFDLPHAIEDYVHRVACAAASGYARPGLAINVVCNAEETATIRHIEAYYRITINALPPHISSLN